MHPLHRVALLVLCLAAVSGPATAQVRYPPVYPAYRYALPESDLRILVKPKEASVYVDGYFAGKVEEFDGAFQRLHVEPGEHEIVVHLDGYRSLKQRLYLSPNATRKIEGTLEKLSPGEPMEPLPQPVTRPDRRDEEVDRMPPGRARIPAPRPIPERPQPDANSHVGTLAIRVQPSGTTVLIDGERWTGPTGPDERLLVQVPEGKHRVEVERDGYQRFVTEIDVRPGETRPVNISLTRSR